ncbi:MAG TPA: glycogen/starch synthase [Candidatus Acidoferrales bacterium]|nr:glycogen/starch synthase [Candidatus Acidoferrales bacterium]
MPTRSIAHLASELSPLAKVGGLGDVVAALAREQVRRGHRVLVVLPRYRDLEIPADWTVSDFGGTRVPWGLGQEPARFRIAESPGSKTRALLVEHVGERRFFDRPGIYVDPATGEGHPDNAERFLYFARAGLEALKGFGETFDVLHAHDQQAAWVPCFVRTHEADEPAFANVATVFTIHNLGYQGIVDPWILGVAGFSREVYVPQSPFEYWGRVNFMKVGLAFADMISTVSPTYALEIQSTGEFGNGLEGVLRRRTGDVRGILNGIDDREWDPATDVHLDAHYDRDHLDGKLAARRALALGCGFPLDPDWPTVGIVSRLVEQKGFDLIEAAERPLCELPARFVVLGVGQPRYQELLRRLAFERPWQWYFATTHDEALAHRIEAGSDLFLMPSRYEPCGLNQMYSLRYGTVPVVRATGGLADTVHEFDPITREGNGFVFHAFAADEMVMALRRALAVQAEPALWRTLQRNGMAHDFSWRVSADGYDRLYEEALERVARGRVPTLETVRDSF